MIDYLQNERIRNGNETVNGIVEENLFLIHDAKIEDLSLSKLFTFFNIKYPRTLLVLIHN
jgi:hypothetical protein